MATTYNFIAANKRKSFILVVVFIAFVIFLGWAIGQWTGDSNSLIVFAALLSLIMTIGGYYGGDKLALTTSGAKGPIKKEDGPELWNMVENLCIASGTPMPKLYLIDDPTINAFATGRDPKHGSIAVTTGALNQLENEELEGVLSHELSHIRNYDVRYMMLVLVLVNAVTLLARWFFWGSRTRRSSDRDNGGNIFAIIGIVLLILSPIIAQLVQLAVSRRREFLADASGALLTRYPAGLESALKKIELTNTQPMHAASDATAHLFFANPFGNGRRSFSRLFMTHPPIEERIKALEQMDSAPTS